jgi:hypothetical protein
VYTLPVIFEVELVAGGSSTSAMANGVAIDGEVFV